MTLHTVNVAIDSPNIQACFEQLVKGDVVVFLDKGLSCCMTNNPYEEALLSLTKNKGIEFYLLEAEMDERSTQLKLLKFVTIVNYSKFVQLTTEHPKTISWF